MADGGVSSMILLVTSLLISGAASVVLLESWGQVAEQTELMPRKRQQMLKPRSPLAAIEEMFS